MSWLNIDSNTKGAEDVELGLAHSYVHLIYSPTCDWVLISQDSTPIINTNRDDDFFSTKNMHLIIHCRLVAT